MEGEETGTNPKKYWLKVYKFDERNSRISRIRSKKLSKSPAEKIEKLPSPNPGRFIILVGNKR